MAFPVLYVGWLLEVAFVVGIAHVACNIFYNLFLHPLRRFPGPVLWRATNLIYCFHLITGDLTFKVLDLHRKYGDVVRVAPNELVFSNGRAWKDIMGHRPGPEMEKSPTFYRSSANTTSAIINAPQEEHQHIRRSLSHGFSERNMREQQPLVKKYIDLLIRRLHENSNNGSNHGGGKKSGAVDIVAYYNYATFDIIGDLAFGEPFGCLDGLDYHPWVRSLFEMARTGSIIQATSYYPFFKKLLLAMIPKSMAEKRRLYQELTSAKLRRRMALGTKRPDLIEGLLRRAEEWNMSFDKLRANASTLIIGGSETTASLLAGVTHLVLTNPDKLRKLTDEIRLAFEAEDDIDAASVGNLPYMMACLKEALRVYPPAPSGLPRIVPEGGANICDYFVPENTVVAIHQWALYHNEKHFTEPETFHPERWLEDPNFAGDDKEIFHPFHMGTRSCIGKNLAFVEMQLILARVLWNFDMTMADDSRDWMTSQKIFILWEKGPLNVYLTPVAHK